MRWPPKKFRVRNAGPMVILNHWVARVVSVLPSGDLSLNMWPSDWKAKKRPNNGEVGVAVVPDGRTITTHGALHEGAPCEVWEWKQGKTLRCHIESIWVRS